jgi:hypothetical protein
MFQRAVDRHVVGAVFVVDLEALHG